ncbi:MAG: Rieske 2Fe-2S domain-containing protein [Rhodospirillaceae bacterium]|nr:Rieske 2Fe-2S domain-containing protein [Rhodospirillaceae bacterium]
MTSEFSDQPTEIWVDSERGVVSRDVFVSQEIYQLELEQIFDKSWIYLAHETEIPETGDYVVRQLGSAPVIVVRLEDGTLRVLLNSCRHRGAKLCRADSGNSAGFVCPFHGWSYGRDGALITTGFDHHFPDNADFSKLGLVSAPRVESYKGLIFGCWNDGVSPLADYLGDIGWYLVVFSGALQREWKYWRRLIDGAPRPTGRLARSISSATVSILQPHISDRRPSTWPVQSVTAFARRVRTAFMC